MSSRRSSESADSEEYELLLQAERAQLEEAAEKELQAARNKPVAFAVRTNISFDATLHGVDAPSPSRVVSFEAREFLHIKKHFDRHWWIGRCVRIGSPLGFVPSPAKLETIYNLTYTIGSPNSLESYNPSTAGVNTPAHLGKPQNFNVHSSNEVSTERGRPRTLGIGSTEDRRGPVLAASRQKQADESPPGEYATDDPEDYRDGTSGHGMGAPQSDATGQNAAGKKQVLTPGSGQVMRRKVFSKKPYFVPPYEIVPCMRPVVFVGPALKGYDVTDMMQKAIFDAMKKHFDERIIVSRVSANLSRAKRVGDLLHLDKKNVMEKGRSRHLVTLVEVQRDLERIFHLASKMQLLLLDCDTVNHPSQIAKTCLAPIVVYIKISSIRVLNRLIKNRGKEQKKYAGVQTAAAEKLLQCPNEAFEFIVDQNTLSAATEALKQFLEGYWTATHPPSEQSKAERVLGADPSEPDSDRPLVPMTPGHPGLSVVTKSALDAGFTSQEISALTGARAAGWLTENGMPVENELGLTGAHYGVGSLGSEYHTMQTHMRNRPGFPEPRSDGEDFLPNSQGELNKEDGMHGSEQDYGSHQRGGLHVGAAHAAAIAAIAAGLAPKPRAVHPSLVPSEKKLFQSDTTPTRSPGLAMGIGMGLASGAAANFIHAALFHHSASSNRNGPVAKSAMPSPVVTAAAATVKPPPLKDLGIHQVEGSDGTHVYQSRSARQAKQRQAELERVRREAEAKAQALQATVGGRRRRKLRERKARDPNTDGVDWPNDGGNWEPGPVNHAGASNLYNMTPTPAARPKLIDDDDWDGGDPYDESELYNPRHHYVGIGPPVAGMSRACPPDA
ncbi:hypothetical protein EG68_05504 [Paragonimus skrjabini miyazakii]|uniref:Guanylate kinase/L-type calcium channel beta subunit domain-containing protein n=1 Tax=Paragonimus skrjabini miyazakii TaxID=59628 RepID=A0A8S9YWY1_9TREM|nr:hypothetical protein EG68_05504 [Paragonimus skrjabini miyazakii]